ncbi:hypothetical protein O6H91_21G007800 [Diphasiastrum complanatum]|uniref:Uncharacterized protein n=1 Tax=Diphasiastrum complanatum TaxID=34168 RepID=A0ACC2AHF8_DIPCM|nr:hypothetical protein O6H91_21G007800 [Diphasiastrum complanatum]
MQLICGNFLRAGFLELFRDDMLVSEVGFTSCGSETEACLTAAEEKGIIRNLTETVEKHLREGDIFFLISSRYLSESVPRCCLCFVIFFNCNVVYNVNSCLIDRFLIIDPSDFAKQTFSPNFLMVASKFIKYSRSNRDCS